MCRFRSRVREIQSATGGLGAMAVIDFVGVDATLALAAKVSRKNGQIALVGLGGGTFSFRFGALPYGCSMVMTMGGSTPELAEVVALVEAGRVTPRIDQYRLDQAADIYEKLKNSQITRRAVLVP